ncbi:MAG: thermonuclease family protein, partial [Sphingopyxis sp.]|nr:thermonuclease family protein [Sphingopyxis sp.]
MPQPTATDRGGATDAQRAPWTDAPDTLQARFSLCHAGGGSNCVVDGDTFWFRGEKIRIADIDTPETHPPRCAEEGRLGAAATRRLHGLLNAGPFSLE